jgi:glycosyltransferase involved in cell wall biosynthesis
MKINNIVFIDSYFKGLYGAPKSMLELAEGVSNRGINVKIVSTKNDSLLEQARDKKLDTFSLDIPDAALVPRGKLEAFSKLCYGFSVLLVWIKCIWKDPFKEADSICVNDIRSFLLVMPLIYKHRAKVVWYVRINDRVKFISNIATRISSKIVLISSDCVESFTTIELEKFKQKFSIINTGFDIDFSQLVPVETSHKPDDFVFVSVGSLCPRKNQLAIIYAFDALLLDNKFLYLIGSPPNAGDNSYFESIVTLIEQLNLQNKIQLVNYTNAVKSYLSFSDVFLFSSHKEGLPRVLIEALLAGCFIVTAKVDGVFDIIKDPRLGLITANAAKDALFLDEFKANMVKSTQINISKKVIAEKSKEQFSFSKFINLFLDTCS